MSDLTDKQAAIEAIENTKWYHINKNGELVSGANSQEHEPLYRESDIYAALEEVPSADVQENVRGAWEEKEVNDEVAIEEWQSACCSVCGKYHTTPYMYYFDDFNFCPNCGADMRGGDA